jgi:branched-chain amino acid aminotransferase
MEMGICEIWEGNLTSNVFEKKVLEGVQDINEITISLPQGVYTTLRTYGRDKTLTVERHFDRLEESASVLGYQLFLKRSAIREKMRIAINESSFSEIRMRLHIPINIDKLYVILEPLVTPSPEDYLKGVAVATRTMHRENPAAKATSFIQSAQKIRHELISKVNEVIMVGEEGQFLEGLSSNFYSVIDSCVWTAFEGVLPGLTREIVLDRIEYCNLPLQRSGYSAALKNNLDEAFITSASRGVLPVVKIDETTIGTGMPGEITQKIGKLYAERLDELLEVI